MKEGEDQKVGQKKESQGFWGIMLMATGGIGALEGYSLAMSRASEGLFLIALFALMNLGAIPVGWGLTRETKGFLGFALFTTFLLLILRLGQVLKKLPSVSGAPLSMGVLTAALFLGILWETRKKR